MRLKRHKRKKKRKVFFLFIIIDWEQVIKKLAEIDLPADKKEELKEKFLHLEAERMRQARKKMTIREFEPLSIIGRGAFGEVRICRHTETGNIVAIKKMRKEDMLNKNQLMHVRTEREILTADNPWIVSLKYSFQDDYFLYLVMDYLPGGDLMNLLMKKDILTEEEARFYTAEMILAVDSVHKLNCIHRDLKPDNILIDKRGHIQLSDFGLSKIADKNIYPLSTKDSEVKANNDDVITNHVPGSLSSKGVTEHSRSKRNRNRLMAYSTVGTPDYIAPEVFEKGGYGQEVDWWSIGVMFFEMVVGYPPFFSENPSDTCNKIVKWKQYFSIPPDANLSPEAKSLILKLVTSADKRLGLNGVDEIKRHPFFRGVDWNNIRNVKAPFIPDIKNDWDNKYFDKFPEQEPFYPPISKKSKKRKDINYAGYTFNRDVDNMKDGFVQALEVLDVVKQNMENNKEKESIIDSCSPSAPIANTTNDQKAVSAINSITQKKSHNNSSNASDSTKKSVTKTTVSNKEGTINKIPLSNINHKKISKSPETKGKEKLNSGITSIPFKSQRDGMMNRISPGKVTKEKVSLINKIKLNMDSNVLKTKTHGNYINTHSNINTATNFGLKSLGIKQNKKK